MALAFDASAVGHLAASGGASLTFSHTCTGSNLILFVGFGVESATDVVTGVTYNNVAMTQVPNSPQANGVPNEFTYLFYLINPATGANNVVISLSAQPQVNAVSASYTGAAQSGQPDNSNKKTVNATSVNNSLTTVADNCWVVGVCQEDNAAPTVGAGVTSRNLEVQTLLGDSNGVQHPAGAYSMTFNSGSGSSNLNMLMASIAPFVASTSTNSSTANALPLLFRGF